ncbi:MAG: polysaccharide deacetylase family protein [Alphaproteobacteria bacterium]|nr:polysaccharide deacetylase family protein [Alphaproteobacteria bacterium]
MNRRLLYFLAALALFAGLIAGIAVFTTEPGIILFEGIEGPRDRTAMPAWPPTSWRTYAGGGASRLSILLTDTDSSWLGLAHGLKSAGVPFSVTTDYRQALRHKVILVYPTISGSVLTQEALQALGRVPRDGGTLIGSRVLGGGLQEVFGFEDAVPSRQRFRVNLAGGAGDAADPRESWLPLGAASGDGAAIGSYAYTNPLTAPLATYEDGSAAIIHRRVGSGHAYAMGIDLGELLLKGHNNRLQRIARSYANEFEPMLDVLLHLVEDIYREAEDRAVILRPVPDGRDLAVVISHDVDYTRSIVYAVDYAQLERSQGIAATYFIQTKYIKDWNDDIILDEAGPGLLRELRDLGMELASHGVSHSLAFHDFPFGDGGERYPDYRPFVQDASTTTGGTILGELRVSRFLLEQLVEGTSVASFRPGYLSNPDALPQALEATGYAFSSSVTANASLTHLPFQLNHDRGPATELPVFEFPVTIEDEALPRLGDRLPQAVALARKIARRGGLCVVLIHPDILGHKLAFERGFIEAVKPFSWFGAHADYGAWWRARNAVQVDSQWRDGRLVVHLTAPLPLDGLTLEVPPGLRLDARQTQPAGAAMAGNRIVLGRLDGTAVISLVRQ